MEAIFAALHTSSQLKILDIGYNNLSSVDPDVLARGVNKLETVHIDSTKLTEEQKTRILTQSLLTTNLKELYMWGNGGVEEGLRTQAKEAIIALYIDDSYEDYDDSDGGYDFDEDIYFKDTTA